MVGRINWHSIIESALIDLWYRLGIFSRVRKAFAGIFSRLYVDSNCTKHIDRSKPAKY